MCDVINQNYWWHCNKGKLDYLLEISLRGNGFSTPSGTAKAWENTENTETNLSESGAHSKGRFPKGSNIERKRHYESPVVVLNNEVVKNIDG